MENLKLILRQNTNSSEVRTIGSAAMMIDIPTRIIDIGDIQNLAAISKDETLFVGSVEFIREAFQVLGVMEPQNMSYPKELTTFLYRNVEQLPVSGVAHHFIKPLITKAWTGFVHDPLKQKADYSDHDLEQLLEFSKMQSHDIVWASNPVKWLSEWRYYIDENKRIIGRARYDSDGLDDALEPDEQMVVDCIDALPYSHPYAIDIGVLSSGETALVEVNDAWAIGLYDRALSPNQYLSYLWKRWQSLVRSEA